jgi:membrane fusion protein (multidrug efflux system)
MTPARNPAAPGRPAVRLLTVLLALGAALSACGRAAPGRAADQPQPPEVAVLAVTPERISLDSEWIATLDGAVNAQIRPQVSGYLVRRVYTEGAYVKKGDLLFEIDSRPFEAALAQARARLAEAQAQLSKADRDVARDTPLAAQHAIAQSQLDNDVEARSAAAAGVQSAQAALDAAQLNVDFTRVTSLVDGVAAIATAQIGDLVGPSTLLTTVSQVDPIKAYFPLSEREYLGIADRLNHASTQPWAGDAALTLLLSDGSTYPSHGRFLAADRDIDVKTGTIRVSAAFPNPQHVLRPGQFARVRARTTTIDAALLVPQRAVSELQGKTQIRVVGPDGTIAVRSVTLGPRVDARWVVQSGLQPGDRVVVEGPATREGTAVTTRPYAPAGGGR